MRFRVVLPVSLGIVSVAFIIWDLYNLRVIGTMGMAWDTGAPVWPYQASLLLQQAINAPAFVLAAPFFFLPHLQTMEVRYPVLLPVILLWWWWLGTRIDFGILGRQRFRRPRLSAFLLAGIASALLYTGTRIIIDAAHRWLIYGPPHLLLLTQAAGLALLVVRFGVWMPFRDAPVAPTEVPRRQRTETPVPRVRVRLHQLGGYCHQSDRDCWRRKN